MTLRVISFQGYCDNIHGYQDLKAFRISNMALCCAILHLIFKILVTCTFFMEIEALSIEYLMTICDRDYHFVMHINLF